MAQLFFRYSTMNAGKSIEVLKVAYNYEERGKNVLVMTSGKDDRFGRGIVKSRIGMQRDAFPIDDDTNILSVYMEAEAKKHIDCVLVDEAQFLKKHHVEELVEIVDSCECPVICYGLKNDFRNELFEGSHYLLIYADKIEEIKERLNKGENPRDIKLELANIITSLYHSKEEVKEAIDFYITAFSKKEIPDNIF